MGDQRVINVLLVYRALTGELLTRLQPVPALLPVGTALYIAGQYLRVCGHRWDAEDVATVRLLVSLDYEEDMGMGEYEGVRTEMLAAGWEVPQQLRCWGPNQYDRSEAEERTFERQEKWRRNRADRGNE
jgi:hypothetical protein